RFDATALCTQPLPLHDALPIFGGLLSAIGISGMDRMVQRNVLATSGRAVEAAGDVGVLLLDKTGTITLGNRMATAFHPAAGVARSEEHTSELQSRENLVCRLLL